MRALEEALFAAEADAQCMTPRSDYHGKGLTDSQQDSGLVNSEVLMGQSPIVEEQYQPDKDDQDLRGDTSPQTWSIYSDWELVWLGCEKSFPGMS